MSKAVKKDILLFIWKVTTEHVESVKNLSKKTGIKYRIFLLTYPKYEVPKEVAGDVEKVIRTNLKNMTMVENKLADIHGNVAAIINRWESTMPLYGRVAELFPYLKNPNVRSMKLSSNKLEMRRAFSRYDKKITPTFKYVKDAKEKTIKDVSENVGFPCIIKPVGLSHSRLITTTYYEDELKKSLEKTFKKLDATFKKNKVEHEPRLIVEQFMEGQMFSLDAYVNSYGKVHFTPMIDSKTGKEAGYDDLFIYLEITPSILSSYDIREAQEVSRKGIYALGLRSSSVHIELMKTVNGWKIIEMASRVGGWRNILYREAYDFDHKMNDYLIHLGKKPVVKSTPKAHVAKLKFYAKKPGKLASIGGFQTVKDLKSVVQVYQEKKIGDFCDYAKNGHDFVVMFVIKTKTRAMLLGEVRKIEKLIKIETE